MTKNHGRAALQSAKFSSPACPGYVYRSGSGLGDSMTNILINENISSGCQITLMMVFVWNLRGRELFPWAACKMISEAEFSVGHHRTGCSQPATMGCYTPDLFILVAAQTTQRRGTKAGASNCGSSVSLSYSLAHVNLACPWSVWSAWWEGATSPSCI